MNGEWTFDVVLGMITVMAIAYLIPTIAVELLVRKNRNAADRKHNLPIPTRDSMSTSTSTPIPIRIVSFLVALVVSGAWVYYVQVIEDRHDFSHGQVAGAGVSGIVVIAALTCAALRWGTNIKSTVLLVPLYSSIGVGLAFAIISAPRDDTGLWGAGLFFLAIGSMLGFLIISSLTAIIVRQLTRTSTKR